MTTTAQAENSDDPSSFRLLIHAVDGAIPYLTPHLLEKCFPAQQVKDILWIGMSVRDACIIPVMKVPKAPKDGSKKEEITATAPKPSGYTFSDNVVIDRWLEDYTRVTVPTFDPLDDAIKFSPAKHKDKTANSHNTHTLQASKQHIMVWTENGRQKLTTDLYWAAAQGLGSLASVSLFDAALPGDTQRRRRAARERTNEWCINMIKQQTQNVKRQSPGVWATHLIAAQEQGQLDDPEIKLQREAIQKAISQKKITGVAFVGWQYAPTFDQQTTLLRIAVEKLRGHDSNSSAILAVLTTQSMSQFMECYRAGMNVVGTNLPAKWAKERLAFVCDYTSWQQQQSAKKPRLVEESGFFKDVLDGNGCIPVLTGSSAEEPGEGSWIRDDRPILPGCTCMTCTMHSRAYLYHLVKTKELLVEILLFLHNLHHLLELSRELSQARKGGNADDIYQHITLQLENGS